MILEALALILILPVLPSFLIFNCSPSAVSYSFEIYFASSAVVIAMLCLKTVILYRNYSSNLRAVFSASSPFPATMQGNAAGCQQSELPDALLSSLPCCWHSCQLCVSNGSNPDAFDGSQGPLTSALTLFRLRHPLPSTLKLTTLSLLTQWQVSL